MNVISINITLGYLLLHMLGVVYMFNMFESVGYEADEIEQILVWLFAPFIVAMVWTMLFIKERRK